MNSNLDQKRTQLVHAIASECGLSKVKAAKAINITLRNISEMLVKGDRVCFVGFGSFAVRDRVARKGPKPNMVIPAHKFVRFRPSIKLKKSIQTDPNVVIRGGEVQLVAE